ncbi:hypothetical protein AB674_14430 [Flavobacterium sp. ABG]|nr:hypothetical protein AB674_14430 [Flavobacterium sp. ABG]
MRFLLRQNNKNPHNLLNLRETSLADLADFFNLTKSGTLRCDMLVTNQDSSYSKYSDAISPSSKQ